MGIIAMGGKYEMYLTWNNGADKFRFPILPEKLEIDYSSTASNVNIDGIGEVAMYKDSKAKRITFSSYFPRGRTPGLQAPDATMHTPHILCLIFETWAEQHKLFQFVVAGAGTTANITCNIESFKAYEQGGDVGTRYYTITLRQHRKAAIKQINVSKNGVVAASAPANRVDSSERYTTYTVKKDDWLSKIAKKLLGNSSRWKEIYELNKDIIKNPNIIHTGQVLKIPAK